MSEFALRNRQRLRAVDSRGFRALGRHLLEARVPRPLGARGGHLLGVHLVGAVEMTRMNETYLRHSGSTDVITFDHSDGLGAGALHGEMFLCVDEAVRQARRYHVRWEVELMRYLVHGLLHLLGHDDGTPVARRRMKRVENRWLRQLVREGWPERVARRRRRAP